MFFFPLIENYKMDIFTYRCISLKDFCDNVGWNYNETLEELLNSDISFGNNADTLVMPSSLADICEKELPENFDYDLMISLGC